MLQPAAVCGVCIGLQFITEPAKYACCMCEGLHFITETAKYVCCVCIGLHFITKPAKYVCCVCIGLHFITEPAKYVCCICLQVDDEPKQKVSWGQARQLRVLRRGERGLSQWACGIVQQVACSQHVHSLSKQLGSKHRQEGPQGRHWPCAHKAFLLCPLTVLHPHALPLSAAAALAHPHPPTLGRCRLPFSLRRRALTLCGRVR